MENINITEDFYDILDNNSFEEDTLKKYINDIHKYKILTKEEELELFTRYNEGDLKAKEGLITHNLRLVASIVKRYYGNYYDNILDLISEGNIGLIKAIEKFDINNYDCKFSTFAYPWIIQCINRKLAEEYNSYKLPDYLYNKLKLYNRVKKYLTSENLREPTSDEMANYLNISRKIESTLSLLAEGYTSINKKIKNDSDTVEMLDFIEDENSDIETNYINSCLGDELLKYFDICKLTDKEKYVIINRFGILNQDKKTLKEIAQNYGLTRQRIAQIEQSAIKKLSRNKKYIKDYYDGNLVDNNYKISNIYENFNEYTREQIDSVLSESDKKFINSILLINSNELTSEEKKMISKYKTTVLPEIRKKLSKFDKFTTAGDDIKGKHSVKLFNKNFNT